MAPPRNTASPHDLAACLRGSLSCLDSELYLKPDLASVVDAYVEPMIQVVKITPKPTVSSLAAAASLAFQHVGPQEARLFADRFLLALPSVEARASLAPLARNCQLQYTG